VKKNKSIKNVKNVSLSSLSLAKRAPTGIYDSIKQTDTKYTGLGVPTSYSIFSIQTNKCLPYSREKNRQNKDYQLYACSRMTKLPSEG